MTTSTREPRSRLPWRTCLANTRSLDLEGQSQSMAYIEIERKGGIQSALPLGLRGMTALGPDSGCSFDRRPRRNDPRHGFVVHATGQGEAGPVAGSPGLDTVTVGLATAAVTCHQGSGTQIAQFEQGLLQLLAPLFQLDLGGSVLRQEGPNPRRSLAFTTNITFLSCTLPSHQLGLACPVPSASPASQPRKKSVSPKKIKEKAGAGNGIRTRDFDLGKVALYH